MGAPAWMMGENSGQRPHPFIPPTPSSPHCNVAKSGSSRSVGSPTPEVSIRSRDAAFLQARLLAEVMFLLHIASQTSAVIVHQHTNTHTLSHSQSPSHPFHPGGPALQLPSFVISNSSLPKKELLACN